MAARTRSALALPFALLALALAAGCESAPAEGETVADTPTFGGGPGGGGGDLPTGNTGGGEDVPAPPDEGSGGGDDGGGPPDAPLPELPPPDAGPDLPDVPDEPDAPGPPDTVVQPDGPCVPDCSAKVCGSDGCKGLCGYCTYPLVCNAEGQCIDVCKPECEGKFCGPDGCGGDCGACTEGLECGNDGLCYEPDCVPDCAGKVCGADGCGGDCGLCAEPKICWPGGYCALGDCGTVTSVGECQGNVAVWCDGGDTLIEQDCSLVQGWICAYDGFANKYVCMDEPECIPKCAGKACGGDGCGGSCGGCTSGWACETGACKPVAGAKCGTITDLGQCDGTKLWFCSAGILYSEDCAVFGETCKWVPAQAKFGCTN